MDMEQPLMREWSSLPHWVKDELASDTRKFHFYRWYIQKLVNHGENMKSVWALFEKNRESFKRRGPVYSLVRDLHTAALGTDPGRSRTDDDRKSIHEAVQKHVDGLTRQIERLGTGSPFGPYPIGIANAADAPAWTHTEKKVSEPFQSTSEGILEALNQAGVSVEIRRTVADGLEWLKGEVEREVLELYLDPREPMRTLAAGAKEWAENCGWGRDDIIWYIGGSVRYWFGGNHFSAVATLVTALTDMEVSEDVVAGVIKRHSKSRGARKVKVEIKNGSREFDRA